MFLVCLWCCFCLLLSFIFFSWTLSHNTDLLSYFELKSLYHLLYLFSFLHLPSCLLIFFTLNLFPSPFFFFFVSFLHRIHIVHGLLFSTSFLSPKKCPSVKCDVLIWVSEGVIVFWLKRGNYGNAVSRCSFISYREWAHALDNTFDLMAQRRCSVFLACPSFFFIFFFLWYFWCSQANARIIFKIRSILQKHY